MNLLRALRVYSVSLFPPPPPPQTKPTNNEFNTDCALAEGEHVLYDKAWLAGEKAVGRDLVEAVKNRWAGLQSEADRSAEEKEGGVKKNEETEKSAEDAIEENAEEEAAEDFLAEAGWGVGCLP